MPLALTAPDSRAWAGPAFTGSFFGAPVSPNPVRIFSVPGHLLRASAAIPHLYRILRGNPRMRNTERGCEIRKEPNVVISASCLSYGCGAASTQIGLGRNSMLAARCRLGSIVRVLAPKRVR